MHVDRQPREDAARIVQQHQAEVWRYLRYLGCSAELADDLTQETFLQYLRAPYEERCAAARSGWLRTVARNLYLRSFRQPAVTVRELEEGDAVWLQFARDDGGAGWLDALRSCLQELDGRARAAVRLQYEQRASRQQIGDELGIGQDGVKSLLRRVRGVLRRCIEGRLAS
jgi:RNA polymerase sigma-70 factor (ECF subfamily)